MFNSLQSSSAKRPMGHLVLAYCSMEEEKHTYASWVKYGMVQEEHVFAADEAPIMRDPIYLSRLLIKMEKSPGRTL